MSMSPSIVVEGHICEMLISAVADNDVRRRMLVGMDVHRVCPMGADEPAEEWHRALVPRGQIGYFASHPELIPAGLCVGMRVSAVLGRSCDGWEVRSITPSRSGAAATMLPVRRQVSSHAIQRIRPDAAAHRHR